MINANASDSGARAKVQTETVEQNIDFILAHLDVLTRENHNQVVMIADYSNRIRQFSARLKQMVADGKISRDLAFEINHALIS